MRIELKSGHRTARRGGQRSGGPLVVHQQRSLGTERERFRTEFSDGMLTLYQDEMPIIYRDEAVILLPGAIGALHARPPTAEHVAIEAAVRAPSSSTRPLSLAMRALRAVGLRRELEEPRARSGAA